MSYFLYFMVFLCTLHIATTNDSQVPECAMNTVPCPSLGWLIFSQCSLECGLLQQVLWEGFFPVLLLLVQLREHPSIPVSAHEAATIGLSDSSIPGWGLSFISICLYPAQYPIRQLKEKIGSVGPASRRH